MNEALCPKCRGPIETRMDGGDHWIGPVSAGAWCRGCGNAWVCEDDFEPLAYWEPRDRLPTPEEEAAHREKHGGDAGWMVRVAEVPVFCAVITPDSWDNWRRAEAARPDKFQSYPHVGGRPVGWP